MTRSINFPNRQMESFNLSTNKKWTKIGKPSILALLLVPIKCQSNKLKNNKANRNMAGPVAFQ